MSAALTRAKNLESGTTELTHPSKSDSPVELGARPVITKAAGVDLGSISEHGMTPLMRAACDGSAGTVQALLDLGANVNAKRFDGFNALSLAAFFGHIHVVWLLLENGADAAETSRSQTLPEMWAEARGFLDIGDILREARSTKQVESSRARTAVIDEPARFSRPTEEEPQQAPQPPLIPKPEPTTVIDEPARFSRPAEEVSQHVEQPRVIPKQPEQPPVIPLQAEPSPETPQHAEQPPDTSKPQPTSRMLPEIIDPPPLRVPAFHPGSVFVARITSSRWNLLALTLVVLLVCGGAAGLLIPRIRKSLPPVRNEAATTTTNLPPDSDNSSLGSAPNVSPAVETQAATTESTTTTASDHNEENAGATTAVTTPNTDHPTDRVVSTDSTEGSAGSRWRGYSRSSATKMVSEPSQNNREFSATTSVSNSEANPRRKGASSIEKSRQKSVTEEEPKPAPITVEMSSRGSVLTPARNAKEVSGSQPPPLGIISDKPRPKVIQWP
jgi:Ankyrin repeats (3 copies)